jgi:hypothetical protein
LRLNKIIFLAYILCAVGRDSAVGTGWAVRGSTSGRARFSTSVQNGLGANPGSYTIGIGSLRGVKRQGGGGGALTTHSF